MNRHFSFHIFSFLLLTAGGVLCTGLALSRLAGADEPPAKSAASAAESDEKPKVYVYELRTYTTLPGRLPALHRRFRDHTLRLFEKHGMKNLQYFTPVDKDDTLIYLLAHESREAAAASWEAFRQDPEWLRAHDASERDGKIVMKVESVFLEPTDYSPKK